MESPKHHYSGVRAKGSSRQVNENVRDLKDLGELREIWFDRALSLAREVSKAQTTTRTAEPVFLHVSLCLNIVSICVHARN